VLDVPNVYHLELFEGCNEAEDAFWIFMLLILFNAENVGFTLESANFTIA
jgi:hypothetical protein